MDDPTPNIAPKPKAYRVVFMNGVFDARNPTAMIATPHPHDHTIVRLSSPSGRGDAHTLVEAAAAVPGFTLRVPRHRLKPLCASRVTDIRVFVPLCKTQSGLQADLRSPLLINQANHRAMQLDAFCADDDLCPQKV